MTDMQLLEQVTSVFIKSVKGIQTPLMPPETQEFVVALYSSILRGVIRQKKKAIGEIAFDNVASFRAAQIMRQLDEIKKEL